MVSNRPNNNAVSSVFDIKSRTCELLSHPGHITFIEIDQEIIFTAICSPYADAKRAFVSYRPWCVHLVLINHYAQKKYADWLNMTIRVGLVIRLQNEKSP